jgi:hypothetical protein
MALVEQRIMSPSIHQGEGYLLDALLASCQKSAYNSPLPSFGRELRPYFDDQVPLVIREKKELPKREKKAAKAKTLPPPVVRAAIDSAKATKIPAKKPPVAPKPKASSMDDLLAWAGPGFCVAPLPEQLPTPSSFLLG